MNITDVSAVVPTPWDVAAAAIRAGGCCVALIVLTCWQNPAGSSRRHRLLYSWYLTAHALSSLPQFVAASIGRSNTTLRYLGPCFILVAGHSYFPLGSLMMAPRRDRVQQRTLFATTCVLLLSIVSHALLFFLVRPSAAATLSFVIYGLAIAVACVGILMVLLRHRRAWQVRLFVLSACAGIVNALLPLLPIWESYFLSRALDVAVYLPGAVIALRWLDARSRDSHGDSVVAGTEK